MKKVITFVMLFVMIVLFSSALADSGFEGTWFYDIELKGSYYSYILIHLFEDGSGLYSSDIIDSGEVDNDPAGVAISWEPCEVGVRIHFSSGYRDFHLLDDGRLSDGSSFAPSVFTKMDGQPPRFVPGSGITVPSGVYTAGDDFPAGTYRIELENEKNSGVIVLYDNMEDTKKAFSYLHEYTLDKNNTTVGKMIIEDGNILDVRNTVIVLLPYEGLK